MATGSQVEDVNENKYDLVVFGATGYTGYFTLEEVARTSMKTGVTWAVAGRSRSKLEKALKNASDATGLDLSTVPVIIADVSNEESLVSMARQSRVVLNTVGPYRFYGEAVVKACVENGASHVDVSGEPQFLEGMQLKYNDLAKEKNVYVVGACGFDSIPADMGVVYLAEKFKGDLNSVESYLDMNVSAAVSGPVLNYGTWQSLIYGIAHWKELKSLRKELYPEPLPAPSYKQPKRRTLHYSKISNSWCLPFMGTDRSVVFRSQHFFYDNYKKRPVQMMPYMKMASLVQAIKFLIGFLIIGLLAQFKFGRALLEQYPTFFSGGKVAREESLSQETNDKAKFVMTLVGSGWGEKLAEATDQHQEPPNKTLTVKVQGTNPGYGTTCKCLVQSAMTVLKEADKMPGSGGVLPPAAAFSKTTLVDRLNELGVTFEVEE